MALMRLDQNDFNSEVLNAVAQSLARGRRESVRPEGWERIFRPQ